MLGLLARLLQAIKHTLTRSKRDADSEGGSDIYPLY